MAIKKTLLQIVQQILSDMDSENVNSIDDSEEAKQVAEIVESTFYNITATRETPDHEELIKLTALSDSTTPTHFQYPDNVKDICRVWYDISDTSVFEYREVKWVDPIEFLNRTDGIQSDYTNVKDVNGGTNLRIVNNKHPDFYTSFDNKHIVMDSHKSTVDSTLQESKVRAWGTEHPVFSISDGYTPDLDETMFPYLIAESKSMCFDLLKGGTTAKLDQSARRNKNHIRNDMFNTQRPLTRRWSNYGRT